MESPDVVDTSDVDEREDFVFSEDAGDYTSTTSEPTRSIREDVFASPKTVTNGRDQRQHSSFLSTPAARHDRFGDHELDNPSPRKRIKIAHDAGPVSPGSTSFTDPEESFLGSSSPMVAHMIQTSSSTSDHSPWRISTVGEEQRPTSFSPRDVSPYPDWHSLFSSPSIGQDPPQSTKLSLISQQFPHTPPRSLSVSTDDLPLVSSLRRPTTPPRTLQNSDDRSSPGRRKTDSMPSSPLTPTSSPALIAQGSSPDPLQLLSPRRPLTPQSLASRTNSPAVAPPTAQSPPIEIPEDPQPLGRYSLRRREPRQLNPYAYDKLLYKQQLKSHPDAIIKVRSPRHHFGSGGTGEVETQDEFIIPIDNTEEDGDYVEVDGRRQRRSMESSDRAVGLWEGDQNARQVDEGWLPEILKGLSSSDEEDNEMAKLARKIRRGRENGQATAKSRARKAAAEARQAEAHTATKRFKPFPIHGDTDGEGSTVLEHVPVVESSLSPSRPTRASSEPVIVSSSPFPVKSPFGHPALRSRASSYSPSVNPNPLPSPGISVYLEQDGSYGFDDHDALPPRDRSPGDHSIVHSAPPSPSAPPSNISGTNSGSEQSPIVEMSSKDRKRFRALKHMMPAAMIARQLGVAKTAHPTVPRARVEAESSGSEAEEVRVIPGIARVRKGRYTDVEVRGDPESSDEGKEDIRLNNAVEMLPEEQPEVKVRRVGCLFPMPNQADDAISLSDDSIPGSSSESGSESSEDEEVHRSLFDRPARSPAREKSLIDWMLSRTRGPGRPKAKAKQPIGKQKPRGSGVPRLDIVTSGARRDHHQTRLPFVSVNTNSINPSTRHNPRHRDRNVQPDHKAEEDGNQKRKRKRQSKSHHGRVYNVHHDATRISSKHREDKSRRSKSALVIEDDDDDLRQALDPGWRAEVERWNKPVPRMPATVPGTNAPVAFRPRVYHRASPQPQNEVLPFDSQCEEPSVSTQCHIVVDMNIMPLLSGAKFGSSSYIGKGLLHQLVSIISGKSEVGPPNSIVQGFEIGPTTSAAVFGALFGPLCDRLTGALRDFKSDDMDTMKEWEPVTRAANQFISWFAVHAEDDQEFFALEMTLRAYLDGLLAVLESHERSTFSLFANWFVVELSARLATGMKFRRGSVQNEYLTRSAQQLMQHLLDIDLRPAFAAFRTAEGATDDSLLSHRAAELWVCLIHLLSCFEMSPEATSSHWLWRLLADLLPEYSSTGAEGSEHMWLVIFSLCAISQFSVHGLSTSTFRLPAAWELVAAALKKIVLIANPEKDCKLPDRALKKRDEYLSCVVSRCFLLWCQWGWRLDDGIVMFKSLQEIFRSRNFANLLNERSAPMGFLENGDLELLSKRDPHDSVFEVFLKMVVQAVHQSNTNIELDPKQRSAHIRKLLQIAVPVSPVPFSRAAPPDVHSLSMLVNRFSAMAVAVHLDPSLSNVKFRVGQARRCVSFKDADDHSRMACVYGMMNFAMIIRHHKTVGGLGEVLGWLGEMADVLMDEYKEGEAGAVGKKTTTTLIQLLIGSVRRVVETQSLDKGQNRTEYPDSALLDGPWVTRVFNPRTDLVTIQQTGVEIRMLVQSFLDARAKALPAVQPPLPPVTHSAENQESQDEYDKLFLYIKDEELLAALGEEAEASTVADLKSKEEALCKVLDRFITPAVYRLVCKHFDESEPTKADATSAKAADEWIDCWVGCANVLVQNNYKDWGLYTKLGEQSWEKIIDSSWRRRVGLRFNLILLRLDPGAYYKMKDEFTAVLLSATLSCKTTIEHEFISVVLSLDGLQHPLLRDAPFDPVPGTRKYEIGQADYEVARERLIETVFANTARCLRTKSDAESQRYAELVVKMLSTMRDIYQGAGEGKEGYSEFCRRVFGMLRSHPELVLHPRVSGAVVWGENL